MKEASRALVGAPDDLKTSLLAKPSPNILVADDDATIVRLSAKALTSQGYQVGTATDGEAAWAMLQTARFDLLITDYQMPKVCGLELIKKVRGARMALPVIMASGALPLAKFSEAPWLHPAAMLQKPFTMVQLLDTVHTVLQTSQDVPEKLAEFPITPVQPAATTWLV